MEKKEDGDLYFIDQIWVPLIGCVRTLIMDEAHATRYSVHPGANKMYHDLRDMYWWPGMKKDIATYPEIPEWKWDRITMDFIMRFPRSSRGSRWTIYFAVLADVTEGIGDLIGYEKCRSPVLWAKIGESRLIGPELVQETTDKVVQIKKRCSTFWKEKKVCTECTRHIPFVESEEVFGGCNLHVPLEEIRIDKTLCFVKEPIEIMDREVK
nr:putative reverse transcriptase domain-containing protein [Tanacetum cinerariifolium]